MRGLLILDACVLIDYCLVDRELVRRVVVALGDVFVAATVLAEVDGLDLETAQELGITVVEPSLEMMTQAASRRTGLSFQDHICLLLARERGWTCVSNDGRLRRACVDDGVAVLWGLELLAMLVETGGLPADEAVSNARQMAALNRYITAAILDRFIERVSSSGP